MQFEHRILGGFRSWGLGSNGTENPFHGSNTLNSGRLAALQRNVGKGDMWTAPFWQGYFM